MSNKYLLLRDKPIPKIALNKKRHTRKQKRFNHDCYAKRDHNNGVDCNEESKKLEVETVDTNDRIKQVNKMVYG